ncbi:MAG TPA: zinc ribbon domain-containing protein [Chitinivibrionales bacterium]|nr:zinc ribbon domain-containing protein [Chitinivibrionales bacterium]
MITCPKCGAQVTFADAKFCPVCGHALLSSAQHIKSGQPEPGTVPWESVETLGVFPALLRTLRDCLANPSPFFARMADSRKTGMAFVYALILGSTGGVLSFIWTRFFIDSAMLSSLPWLGWLQNEKASSAITLMFMPLMIAIKEFVVTAYFHALVVLGRTKHRDITSTFMAVCYSESASAFNLIPVAGSFLSAVFSVIILAAAFSKVHRMSTFKAVMIILLPIVIIGILLAVALAAAIGAGFFVKDILKGL